LPTYKPKDLYTPLETESDKDSSKSLQSSSDEAEEIKDIYPIDGKLSGIIIGYQGSTIRKMEQDTGARITLIDWEEDKALLIRGPDKATINRAKKRIEIVIKGANDRKKRSKETDKPAVSKKWK
jgi:polyribonucleotide nucleotidyltransferase